jgi:hypothetical protein
VYSNPVAKHARSGSYCNKGHRNKEDQEYAHSLQKRVEESDSVKLRLKRRCIRTICMALPRVGFSIRPGNPRGSTSNMPFVENCTEEENEVSINRYIGCKQIHIYRQLIITTCTYTLGSRSSSFSIESG